MCEEMGSGAHWSQVPTDDPNKILATWQHLAPFSIEFFEADKN